jgi:hypothetical protein
MEDIDDFDAGKADLAPMAQTVPDLRQTPSKPASGEFIGASKRGRPEITWIERLGPDCALGTDGLQWIVFQRRSGEPMTWQGERWRAVGFIHCSKRALIACIAAKGLKLSAAGRKAIERQDAKFCRWRRATPMESAA